MAEPIYKINFTVDRAAPSVTPTAAQPAGYYGDDQFALVTFTLEDAVDGHRYRIEIVDGNGAYDITELLDAEGGVVSYTIPAAWTAAGTATLQLVEIETGDDGTETAIVHYPPVRLLFEARDDSLPMGKMLPAWQKAMTATELAAENAQEAADRIEAAEAALTDGEARVQEAVEDAAAAKSAAETALENAAAASREAAGAITAVTSVSDSAKADVKETANGAIQAVTETADQAKEKAESAAENAVQVVTDVANSVQGVYIGSGDMPEGYSVQIDPDGDVLEIDTELDEESGNPVTNAAIAKALAENQTAITCGADEPSGGIDGDVYIQFIEE